MTEKQGFEVLVSSPSRKMNRYSAASQNCKHRQLFLDQKGCTLPTILISSPHWITSHCPSVACSLVIPSLWTWLNDVQSTQFPGAQDGGPFNFILHVQWRKAKFFGAYNHLALKLGGGVMSDTARICQDLRMQSEKFTFLSNLFQLCLITIP